MTRYLEIRLVKRLRQHANENLALNGKLDKDDENDAGFDEIFQARKPGLKTNPAKAGARPVLRRK